MKCVFHSEKDADYVCPSCGRPVCRECITNIDGRAVCKACAYNMQAAQPGGYRGGDDFNSFLFFIYLLVPGLRHMYIGLMKRGFQFLSAFFGLICLAALLGGNLGGLIVPVILIVWFYSAFDSYQYRKLMAKGEKVEDKPIFDNFEFNDIKNYVVKRRKLTGTVIIILGIYMFFRELSHYSYDLNIPGIVIDIIEFGFNIIVPALLIIGGIYLMKFGRTNKDINNE